MCLTPTARVLSSLIQTTASSSDMTPRCGFHFSIPSRVTCTRERSIPEVSKIWRDGGAFVPAPRSAATSPPCDDIVNSPRPLGRVGLLGLLLARAAQLQDLFADVLGRVLDFLHALAGPGPRGLVPALGLSDVVLYLNHELLEAVIFVHAWSFCWGCHHRAPRPRVPHNSTSSYLRVWGSSRSITSRAACRYLGLPSRSMSDGAHA